jgi:hypothetical protein
MLASKIKQNNIMVVSQKNLLFDLKNQDKKRTTWYRIKREEKREPYWLIVMITRSIFMVSACAEPSYRSPIPMTAADWAQKIEGRVGV